MQRLPTFLCLKNRQNFHGVDQQSNYLFSSQDINHREQTFQQVCNRRINQHRFSYDIDICQVIRFKKKKRDEKKLNTFFIETALCPTSHMVLHLFLNYTILLSKQNYSINMGLISYLLREKTWRFPLMCISRHTKN